MNNIKVCDCRNLMLTYSLIDKVSEDTRVPQNSSNRIDNIFMNIDGDLSLKTIKSHLSHNRHIIQFQFNNQEQTKSFRYISP